MSITTSGVPTEEEARAALRSAGFPDNVDMQIYDYPVTDLRMQKRVRIGFLEKILTWYPMSDAAVSASTMKADILRALVDLAALTFAVPAEVAPTEKRTFPPDHNGLHAVPTIAVVRQEGDGTERILHFEETKPSDYDFTTLISPQLLREMMQNANNGIKAMKLLRDLEWIEGDYADVPFCACPSCEGEKDRGGHKSDCALAALLGNKP